MAPKGLGGEQVEGRQAVRELLRAGVRKTKDVWIADDIDPAEIITEIERLATGARVPVQYVPRGRLEREARTDAPQGILAHAAGLPEAELDHLVRRRHDRPLPFLLAVDGVTDPGNLGALLRTAECAGVTGAVLPRHRAAHVTPSVAKAAAGAVEHLPIAVVPGLPTALMAMARAGVWTVGLDGESTTSLFDLDLGTEAVALVLGSEGEGLSRLTRQRCDVLVSLPLLGAIDSLNVSAAAAVATYEVARRRRIAQSVRPTDKS